MSTAIATAAVSAVLTLTACGGGSDTPKEDAFTGSGWVSTIITPLVPTSTGVAEDCDHVTDEGRIKGGVPVTISVGEETVGSAILGVGKFYSDSYTSGCKWQFSAEISRTADEYTVQIGDSATSTASLDELKAGSFQFGTQVTAIY
ncbi:hypothetical protein SEA_DOGFISH_35 [Gordonia phage Dogfish]|nr:hypothetical protein SEA_DOGFISH_35 [Gordonia phage Dogfish]